VYLLVFFYAFRFQVDHLPDSTWTCGVGACHGDLYVAAEMGLSVIEEIGVQIDDRGDIEKMGR
jgi:hypothetical protein